MFLGRVKKIKSKPVSKKLFPLYMSGKGITSTIYMVLKKHNKKKWVKDLNRPITREDILMTNKHKMFNIISC